jgi:hypothetical protein
MVWIYHQSSGRLYQGKELVETGYSGSLTNKNNPDRQHVRGMGPLPRGTYRITGHSTSKGPYTIILVQTSGDVLWSFGVPHTWRTRWQACGLCVRRLYYYVPEDTATRVA